VKVGDLVMKAKTSGVRDAAGFGIVIDTVYKSGGQYRPNGRGCKVRWSNDYGTFWAAEDKLELINENR